jgi:hypothetical protein
MAMRARLSAPRCRGLHRDLEGLRRAKDQLAAGFAGMRIALYSRPHGHLRSSNGWDLARTFGLVPETVDVPKQRSGLGSATGGPPMRPRSTLHACHFEPADSIAERGRCLHPERT